MKSVVFFRDGAKIARVDNAGAVVSVEQPSLHPDVQRALAGDKNLSGADLSSAGSGLSVLRGADLTGADLRGANLTRADLIFVDLTGADLRGANLSGAYLSETEIGGVKYDAATVWPDRFTPPASV